jgi:geranylgeranyl diphosphate synthase type II
MHTLEQLREYFLDYLNQNKFTQSPQELYEPNNYFLQIGGKRLRPALLLLCTELYNKSYTHALDAALATEYFHNFTLIHDDIMDDAPLRRGHQTLHEKYNITTAILSGDVLLIYAYQCLSKIESKYFNKIFNIFTQTAIEVCEGQQYDINFEQQQSVTELEYINMIKLKTAVLLAASMQIGAIIGGASAEDAIAMYQYGLNLGIAFQIQDDILDCYGDTKDVGKQLGGDILQNKKTILFIKALEQSKNNNDKTLEEIINSKNTDNKVEKVLSIYNKYNIYNYSIERRNSFIQIAKENLEKLSISNEKKEILESLIQHLVIRNS